MISRRSRWLLPPLFLAIGLICALYAFGPDHNENATSGEAALLVALREPTAVLSLPTVSEVQVQGVSDDGVRPLGELAVVEVAEPEATPEPTPEPVVVSPVIPWRQPVAVRALRPAGSYYDIVAAYFPEYPAYAWSVLMCESGHSPGGALLMLSATGAAGELTDWQIMPGNFRTMGEWPVAGDFEQHTRLARKWHDLIGGFAARGGWSCA